MRATTGDRYDVLIVGAGIQGLSAALDLALRSRRVLVVEKHWPGRHASGVNAGGVRSLWRDPAEIPLARAALDIWRDIERFLGADVQFQASGTVRIAESAAEMGVLEARAAETAALGYAHEEVIGRNALRALVPQVAGHCVGGLLCRDDGSASPHLATWAYYRRALREGVDFRFGEAVSRIERTPAGWRVTAGEDAFEAGVLINCAGAWGGKIAALIGDDLPLKMEAPTMMVTQRMPAFLGPVCGLVGRKLSFKQTRAGTVLIGGGHRGFVDRETETAAPDPRQLAISARTVSEVFPIMRDIAVARCWCGIEGMTPDHLPILGPSPSAADAFHAFGFSAHGFALGPITGRILADLVTVGHAALPLAAFAADRFGT